jgi:DNA-binding HxlR family transcriptional regulator
LYLDAHRVRAGLKMLTQTLRKLQHDGLVTRTVGYDRQTPSRA